MLANDGGVNLRFIQAGGRIFPFDSPALDALFKISKGNPRTICGIGQVALEIAGTTEQTITPDVIQEVSATRIAN